MRGNGTFQSEGDVTVVGRCSDKGPETNILSAWALPIVSLLEEHSRFE